jgi:hypothetical protein
MTAEECNTTMATETATANTREREGSDGAVIGIADISRSGVSS